MDEMHMIRETHTPDPTSTQQFSNTQDGYRCGCTRAPPGPGTAASVPDMVPDGGSLTAPPCRGVMVEVM